MKFSVENMSCSHCVSTITRAVQALDPAARVEVDLASATVVIEGKVDAAAAIAAMANEGYPARVHESGQATPAVACCGGCQS